jgi:hypothetical protein
VYDWNAVMGSKEVGKSKGFPLISAILGVVFIVALIFVTIFMKKHNQKN